MNVKRFQFILSQEDPLVVSEGLDTFRLQILREHDAILAFGYNGRSIYVDTEKALYPSRTADIKGLLSAFIQSSPFCEEVFVLWRLIVDRNELRDLCASLMQCISAILYCSYMNEIYCTNIVSKILSEFNKCLQQQLSSGNIQLTHSTLGLLISMARSSSQNCKDVYQRVLYSMSNDNIYVTMLQKGKIVKWITNENLVDINTLNFNKDNIHEVIVSDSRSFIVILILTILKNADSAMYIELMNSNSLFKRILNSIHKDEPNMLKIIFEGLLILMDINAQYIVSIDNNCINNLFVLYKSENEHTQEIVDDFMQKYSIYLTNSVTDNSSYYHNRGYFEKTILYITQELRGHVDLRHRKLQLLFLKKRPNLLGKCINSLTLSWDPVVSPSYDYVCALSHLTYLLCNVDLDKKKIRTLKENMSNEKADSNIYKSSIEDVFATFVPANLYKKDLSKLLQSPNKILQKMGLNVMIALTKRLSHIVHEFSPNGIKNNLFLTYFNMATSKHFPDFQIISNLFLKLEKCLYEASLDGKNDKLEMEVDSEIISNADENQDDFDFSLSSAKNGIDGDVTNEEIMLLVLHLLNNYANLVPSLISQSSFDVLKVLDFISWQLEQNINSDSSVNSVQIALTIIMSSCNKGLCHWFGSHSDTVKMVTALLTNSDDWMNIKRSSLIKLFLLYSNENNNKILTSCEPLLVDIVNNVLKQSGIFWMDGKLEYENSIELNMWRTTLKNGSITTLQLMDIILRVHKHWHINYCVEVNKMQQVICDDISMSKYIQKIEISDIGFESSNDHSSSQASNHSIVFSSLIYCGISLCCSNFDALLSHLPNHIRSDIVGSKSKVSDSMFLNKFNNSTLCNSMQDLICDAIMRITFLVRDRMWYIKALVSSIKYLDSGNEGNFTVLITKVGKIFGNDTVIVEPTSTTEQNYALNVLGKLIFIDNKKKRHKASKTDESVMLARDSMIKWSPFLVSTLLQNINSICDSDPTRSNMNMPILKDIWILLSKLCLEQQLASESSSLHPLFSWILCNISSTNDRNACLEFINEGKVLPFIDMIYYISQILKKKTILSNSDSVEKDKRKSYITSDILLQAKEICSSLVKIIVDFIQSDGFSNSLLLKSLTTSFFRLGICDKCEYFGKSVRQIIKVAATSLIDNNVTVFYERRSVRGGSRDSLIMFWNLVAQELCRYSFDVNDLEATTKDTSYNSEMFSLGWLVQQVMPVPMLRKKYVNIALHNSTGYELMDMNKNANVRSIIDSTVTISSEIPISILNCVSQSKLSLSITNYISHKINMSNFHDLNSLVGISIGIDRSSHNNNLKFYCDPISLVDASLVLFFKELRCRTSSSANNEVLAQYLSRLSNRSTVIKLMLSESRWTFDRNNTDILSEISLKCTTMKPLGCVVSMLQHGLFTDSKATTKICKNYINSPTESQNYYLKTEFMYDSLRSCLCDILTHAVSSDIKNVCFEEGIALWNTSLMEAFSYFVDAVTELITSTDHSSNAEFVSYSMYICSLITFTIPDKIFSKSGKRNMRRFQLFIDSMQQLQVRMRKRVNKWIKSCLKHSFDVSFTLNLLCQLNATLYSANTELDGSKKLLLWNNAFKFDRDDYYNPSVMLQLLLGHSKLLNVLNGADSDLHIHLFRLILGNFYYQQYFMFNFSNTHFYT